MTRVLAILNLTPDSFSGDGVMRGEALETLLQTRIEEGAHAIDIGAESTRPGAASLSAKEEWDRLAPFIPVLGAYARRIPLSIDTRHVQTAQRALAQGFGWINDVSGGSDAMLKLAAETGAMLVLMHSLGVPADRSMTLPEDVDVIEELLRWGRQRLARAETLGVARVQIMLDPGIGFGKSRAQNWEILRRAGELKTLGVPIVIGHSRKSFLQEVTEKPPQERDGATLEVSRGLIAQGIDWLRVHDVAGHAALSRGEGI